MKKMLDIWILGCYYIKAVCERRALSGSKTADVPCKLNNEKHAIKSTLDK